MRIPLIGSSYPAFSTAAAAQQSMNCYPETIEASGEKNKTLLRGIPGIRRFKNVAAIDAAATPIRGLWSGGGRLFVAAGTKQFEVDAGGSLVGSVHTIADDAPHSPVQFFPNGNQLFFVSAGTAYCDNGMGPVAITLPGLSGTASSFNSGGLYYLVWASGDKFDPGLAGQTITFNGSPLVVTQVFSDTGLQVATDPGVHPPLAWNAPGMPMAVINGAFLDGYFIVARAQSRQFNISPVLNGIGDAGDGIWSALDYDQKVGYPDYLAAVWAEPPLLYLLGTESLEVWRDTGNSDFPFQRVDGGFARVGLAAPWSPCSIAGKLHMVAGGTYGQAVAVRMEGVTPVRVSTHAVEEAWAAAGTLAAEGVSYSYLDRGHWFWVINFAGSTCSWVYDATESGIQGQPVWHQRARWNVDTFLPYRPWFHTFVPEWGANGKHIVGDYLNGNLYEMSSDFFDDDGTDIRAQRAMAHLYQEGKRQFMSRLEFEMETGLVSGGGTVPTLTVDFSDDRGHTFGTPRPLSSGVSGAYTTRVFLNRCGSFRDRVVRFNFQGQSKLSLIDANAEIEVGYR